jgi:DNA-binding MarR family transcriptional regulator
MDSSPDPNRELILLEQIEQDPDVTQATLAAKLGVAVGTVNWHLKRFVSKGYVKVKRAQRRKLRYIITPEGLAFRARLTVNYVDQSMRLYRRVREMVQDFLVDVKKSGYDKLKIEGDGDIAEICRLSCLEHGITVVEHQEVPVLEVHGYKVVLHMDGFHSEGARIENEKLQHEN